MTKPFISYLITTKNGTHQLKELLVRISKYMDGNECIILDDYSDSPETLDILEKCKNREHFNVYQHKLQNDYSRHKNFAKDLCLGEYIFQIDDDELPSDFLLENIKSIIDANPSVECFLVPRINDFIGVNQNHANQWGWRLSPYEDRLIVNFPDYQFRIFRNLSYIKWERPLHEKIEGAKVISKLPPEFDWAIKHNKTIEKQVQTNIRYNKDFSEELNKGFKV